MSYYPDGMRMSDLPGFYDETRKVSFYCDGGDDNECLNEFVVEMDVDGQGGYDEEATCPECGRLVKAYIQTPRELDDEMRAYYAD